jgi:hypothetical protein
MKVFKERDYFIENEDPLIPEEHPSPSPAPRPEGVVLPEKVEEIL